jgi:hypothetical protein
MALESQGENIESFGVQATGEKACSFFCMGDRKHHGCVQAIKGTNSPLTISFIIERISYGKDKF